MNVMKYKSLWKMNRIGFMVRYVKASNIEYYGYPVIMSKSKMSNCKNV